MVTAVWGDWHIKMLLEMNLPTLLAPGNMPSLSRLVDTTYRIFTREEDRARLDTAPVIQELRKYIKVEVDLLTGVDLKNPIAAHHTAWTRGIDIARATGSLILLLPPDVAWSSSSFKTVGEKLAEGYRAIFMTYLRAEDRTFENNILAMRTPGEHSLEISGNDLVTLCVRSFHPLMAAYLRDSDYFPIHPEMMFWPVEGEGMVLRVLAREMFLFDPSRFAVNEVALPTSKFAPGEACFISDSDELFAVSLAPLGTDINWHLMRHKADPIEIGGWWLAYDSPVNDFIVSHKVRWHFAPVTEEKWRAVETASDVFIRRVASTREANRIWLRARQLGCGIAAKLIALSIYGGQAPHVAKGRDGNIVLLPTDEAFAAAGTEREESLFDGASTKARMQLFRSHLEANYDPEAESDDPLAFRLQKRDAPALKSISGQVYPVTRTGDALYVGDAMVCGDPMRLGPHTIYVIDKLLD